MKDPVIRKIILKQVGRMVHSEIVSLSKGNTHSGAISCLLSANKDAVKDDVMNFDWEKLNCELKTCTPILHQMLHAASSTKVDRPNRDAVICTIIAIICKIRRPSMSMVQKIVSLILYSGHSAKQVSVVSCVCHLMRMSVLVFIAYVVCECVY